MNIFSKMSASMLSWTALGLAAIMLFSVNLIGWEALKLYRLDVTENELFTLTDSTRKVIRDVDDPITLKLYYTDALGARAPAYGLYADRIQALLNHYSSLSNGKIVFQKVSPEPFSDEEDRAVAAGLTAVQLGGNDKGYLALVGSNSTDDEESIAFMSLDRSAFLEYDLTRMVHKLSKPTRKTVGLITGLDMNGAMGSNGRPLPPWLIRTMMEEFFVVKNIGADAKSIADGIDILLIVAPGKISDELAFAIDQFALAGKPVIAYADPFAETRQRAPMDFAKNGNNFSKLLAGWGAKIATDKVVGDPEHSRRIRYNSRTSPMIVNYIVWLTFDDKSFDSNDPIFSKVERLVFATAGVIRREKGAGTKFTPLLSTGRKSSLIATKDMVPPSPVKLLNGFAPDNTFKVLVARLTGKASASVSIGNKSKPGQRADGNINVLVISDSDTLYDTFWSQARDVSGQQVIVPVANNHDLLLNALENMSGGAALSGLRGRGVENRPFTRVQEIQRKAESRFRKREKILNGKLVLAQKKLNELQKRASKGNLILSPQDRTTIANFRQQVVSVRRDLRGVQLALKKDIAKLEFWLQLGNTIGVPLLIIFGGLFWLGLGRAKRSRAARQEN